MNMRYFKGFEKFFWGVILLVFATKMDVFAENSLLSSGTWYKMSVSSTGMYRLSYSDLVSMGVDVGNIDPRNIRIFHNGGGVLPKINKDYYPDDLYEIPVFVSGEDDGVFNSNDHIIFYARGPVVWNYYSSRNYYGHVKNPYTDNTYVFMTIGDVPGRRIQTENLSGGENSVSVTEFLDYKVKDVDDININNMGCTWYFDPFDLTLQRSYEFTFSNMVLSKNAKMRASVASKNATQASFIFKYNNNQLYSRTFGPTNDNTFANFDSSCYATFKAIDNTVKIDINYVKTTTASVGWLDYISMNAWCDLVMTNNVMSFRNPECSDESSVYEYKLQNASNAIQVWNVTDPINPTRMSTTLSSATMSFKIRGNVNNEFIAFNGNEFNKPVFVEIVANQNLHAKRDIDYLIITHDHYDHLDYETAIALRPKIRNVITGLGVGSHFRHWGYDDKIIREVDWNESVDIDGGKIHCLPARHFSGRLFENRTLWASFLVEAGNYKLYIGGDSGYDDHYKIIGDRFGGVDFALLEAGQYDKNWRYIHEMPEEFVKAAKDLKASRIIPVHNSKFSICNHAWYEPLNRISELTTNTDLNIATPKIGEVVELRDASQRFDAWWKEIK